MNRKYIADRGRISRQIENLYHIGTDKMGGTTRLLYSPAWLDAQKQLSEWMYEMGLAVKRDAIGNLFGRFEGKDKTQTVLTGSHLDTVLRGGAFDGVVGIVAGLEAIRLLKEKYGQPKLSLEIVAICDEEGTRFRSSFLGSRVMNGLIDMDTIKNLMDDQGISFEVAMKQAGFKAIGEKQLGAGIRNDIAAFIELHVEQGRSLYDENMPIGIVNVITGQTQLNVAVVGQMNHAGTTGMNKRKDAMVASAEMVVAINKIAKRMGGGATATVGKMVVEPNVPNVIPGKTKFTVDVRHPERLSNKELVSEIKMICKEIADTNGVSLDMDTIGEQPPITMHDEIIKVIQTAASEMGLWSSLNVSGAGHDAQIFAQKTKTGMIFIPSVNGISHSSDEWTEINDIVTGIELLTKVIYKLAY